MFDKTSQMTMSNLRSSSSSKGAHSKRIVGGCFEARVKYRSHRGWWRGGEGIGGRGRVDRLSSHLAWIPGGKGRGRGKASRNCSRRLKGKFNIEANLCYVYSIF